MGNQNFISAAILRHRMVYRIGLMVSLLLFLMVISGTASATKREFDLTIEEVKIHVAPGMDYNVFAFNGKVPGPLFHVKEGDKVTVHVTNNTSLPHTIHWHGLYQKNNWQMDGVPGVAQAEPIEAGDTFTYHWTADKPGTMWYHCHVNANEHVGIRGMWGPIVVDPKNPIAVEKKVTKEVIMMMSSWESEYSDKYGKGAKPTDLPDYFSINAKSFPLDQPLRVKKGDIVRVRFIGAGNNLHAMHSHGHDMVVTFRDGVPLASPYSVDTVLIYPGSHNDVIMDMNNSGRFIFHDHIDTQSTNAGKFPGGAVTIIEYDDNSNDDWYAWKDKEYDPDFFYSESMKKGYGMFENEAFAGEPLGRKRRKAKH